jgi:hypothetical protein
MTSTPALGLATPHRRAGILALRFRTTVIADRAVSRKKEHRPARATLPRLVWPFAVIALAIGCVFAGTQPAAAAAVCLVDTAGADDINATQKDLNEFCQSVGNDGGLIGCSSSDANLTWTWDDTGWTGANTGDACALYDTDGDGKANFALCATVQGNPAVQSSQSPRFYSCDDSKALNCGGSSQITAASSCAVSNVADVFTGSHKSGNVCNGSNCLTRDTQAQCCVKSGDFPSGSTPELIDVCSYPSSSPSSAPSECVKAVLCTSDSDCTALNDACNVGTCASDGLTKRCVATPKTDGTGCNDGNACTQSDTCQSGVCTGSNPVACSASDQCHLAGTCDPATGQCSNPVANGTSCNDGNACTQSDTCQGGVCTGSNSIVCSASDQCHVAGTCDPATGQCSNPAATNGTGCNDGNACTQSDTCQSGVCTGSNPVACSASDQCHVAGTCDPASGQCSNPAATNGTTCNDGNACTQSDTCQSGVCTGSNPVVCTALDQCHVAGICNVSTGTCSNPNAPDGTSCSDHNACTLSDTCQGGTCVGGNSPSTEPGCKIDTGGADDAVGQKDLTEFCLNRNATCAGTIFTWQWDDTAWTGTNTGDACALYDTDGDGFANYALCVTVAGKPATQASQSPRFYTCNDTKQFNCTGATLITTTTTSCIVNDLVADPFAALSRKANKCAGSDCLTKDTQAQCCVKTADLPATAVLIDVCSYPSQSPSSDPSECVKTVFCSSNSDCSVTNPEGTCTGTCTNTGGVNQCVF